jgi:hypothetical protein
VEGLNGLLRARCGGELSTQGPTRWSVENVSCTSPGCVGDKEDYVIERAAGRGSKEGGQRICRGQSRAHVRLCWTAVICPHEIEVNGMAVRHRLPVAIAASSVRPSLTAVGTPATPYATLLHDRLPCYRSVIRRLLMKSYFLRATRCGSYCGCSGNREESTA